MVQPVVVTQIFVKKETHQIGAVIKSFLIQLLFACSEIVFVCLGDGAFEPLREANFGPPKKPRSWFASSVLTAGSGLQHRNTEHCG